MAILGLGTDIAEISRFENKQLTRLAQRVLTPNELTAFDCHHSPHRFLAKRFAAKEAASKALGTGIAQGVTFQHFEISNLASGKPVLQVSGAAQAIAESMAQSTVHWHLSISDEKNYTVATVIIES
ncbi:holo-ACP synthase [Algibacillus agarilyticus]|uniref:holo-ACP synthase n=1 Tax=Algibacillus agarilyticus TaxID=2234133 RepID=UPI000DD06DDB|nr:holo-ACP synthase [Algibacillus agarilyticus]